MIVTALLALRLSCAFVAGDAPDGFVSVENRDDGFSLFCPKSYKEIPPPPGDPVMLAKFVRSEDAQIPKTLIKKGTTLPKVVSGEICVLSIDKPVAGVTHGTGGGGAPSDSDGGGAPPAKTEPQSQAEAAIEALRAKSLEEFVKVRMPKWSIVSHEEKGERGSRRTEYTLQFPGSGPAQGRGAAWLYDRGDHWLGLLGWSKADDFETQRRQFEKSANSLHEIAISEAAVREMEQFYSRRPEYNDPKFRIERRRDLRRGWKSIDTPNYLIVHHSKDEHLLSRLEHDLEAMRATYQGLFPPAKPIEAASVVRVCKDRAEYLQYGGMPSTAGYWNSALRELVLYDNVKGEQGSRLGNQDSYIVVYHEAFHQYIHYSAGELAPHSWFNEGYGDYFSGAKIYSNSLKVQEIGPNPWRLPTIKQVVDHDKELAIEKMVHASQREAYSQAAIFYPQAWSFIYFLNRGLYAQSDPKWSQILPRYFETLKASYAEELARVGDNPTLAQKEAAGEVAKKKAVDAAFDGVDYDALQAAWRKFVAKLK